MSNTMKIMKVKKSGLGPLETQFFAWAQLKKRTEVKTGDLVQGMKLSAQQEADLFHNLSSSGFILKLWRGFYLVPERIPPNGQWAPSPYLIINRYMFALGAQFQVSGLAIFNLYGYSTQIAQELVIYNDKLSKKVDLLHHRFIFVKVKSARLGHIREFQPQAEGALAKVAVSSPEQALLDAVYDYKRFGSLPQAYQWIKTALKKNQINAKELARAAFRHGNNMSQKRIGWALEKLGVEEKIYSKLLKKTGKSLFLVPLDPHHHHGPIHSKWKVIENVQLSPH